MKQFVIGVAGSSVALGAQVMAFAFEVVRHGARSPYVDMD